MLEGLLLGKSDHERDSKTNEEENVGKQEIEHSVCDSPEINLNIEQM